MNYEIEREGQLEFFDSYIKLVDNTLTYDDILGDNTDGIINGNILEFKLIINNLNAALFQTIKYLSVLRIKGKEIPANILLISLNDKKAYLYKSADYLSSIQKVYNKSASLSNEGFTCNKANEVLRYAENELDEARLIELLRSHEYTKIDIDEDCIVGWATRYYRENPHAKKSDFIGDLEGKVKIVGEIRKPTKFKAYINPYTGKTNERFKYLMDKLNDTIQKKTLGAFYTADLYAEKSLDLVRQAIALVPDGNDYIILDRCAGTGNLERNMTDEELSHCILSTVEYYEYKVLLETLGDKVRHIIPPTEKEDTFNAGLVRGADALSEEYLNNAVIKKYFDNPNCSMILFENPPYAEEHGSEKKIKGVWKKSYLSQEMKKDEKIKKGAADDIGNIFIWSAFKYYLRQPTDSYIVYSPVKYWKSQHLVNKKFIDGFAFNRRHFHTNIDACIMCALFQNIDDFETDVISLTGFDIIENKIEEYHKKLDVKKIYSLFSSSYYDKRNFADDEEGIACYSDGNEETKKKLELKPRYNPNIVAYLAPKGSGFDKPDLNCTLTTAAFYNAHGFYMREDTYLQKLPMFAASRYVTYHREWTERARIMKSGDGKEKFERELSTEKLCQALLKCLLFTTLEMQNHCKSFVGSDNRVYQNKLCLDNTNGQTIAAKDLENLNKTKAEDELIAQWEQVLQSAKKTAEYNPNINYGVYQIFTDLNTFSKDEKDNIIYDYPELNGNLTALKALVKRYYQTVITPFLFEYEFIK